jgi:hypothetical protein
LLDENEFYYVGEENSFFCDSVCMMDYLEQFLTVKKIEIFDTTRFRKCSQCKEVLHDDYYYVEEFDERFCSSYCFVQFQKEDLDIHENV